MRSLLLDVYQGIHNVYNGWITWNLFLAFIPLLLSFLLFRRRSIPPMVLVVAWGFTALLGVVGLKARFWRVLESVSDLWQGVQMGMSDLFWQLVWLGLVGLVALGLSRWLFRRSPVPQPGRWWLGVVVFIAFLPNAPYVLTDVIHLIRGISSGDIRVWVVVLVFIPIHACAILLGFQAYVMALINVNYFLKARGLARWTTWVELLLHWLSAVGIYLGRFVRLNSWELVIDPTSVGAITLNSLTEKRPVVVMVVTFLILTGLYWVMKQVTLGLKLRIDYARQGLEVLGEPQ